jgi:hypothetical protein
MRVNEKTIKMAKIRRYIRKAIEWDRKYGGLPTFYTSEDYKRSRGIERGTGLSGNKPYYSKTERSVNVIAEKIYDLMKE